MKEAELIVQDLMEIYGASSKLLNIQAVCLLLMEKHQEAFAILTDTMAKYGDEPDTLANLIVAANLCGKSDTRFLSLLKETKHPLLADLKAKDILFDASIKKYIQSS